ncbi:hypothetical protein [uncultured Aquimarina sp.]|uniref:hypothetical protein n=1 Tax=uncultured Aquimarina sp. TaxID=575652 RepID=UPI002633AB02|nr:hypothetical protein [uncultured Aquimarina sp.]
MKDTINVKAQTIKKMFSRTTSIERYIDAKPEIIWDLLVCGKEYPQWNSTITVFEGIIKQGQTIKLKSYLAEKRTFKLKIKEFIPNKKLVWADFMGRRTFLIQPYHEGVMFRMSETIGGPLFPIFSKMIPPFDEAFEKFTNDLEKEVIKQKN